MNGNRSTGMGTGIDSRPIREVVVDLSLPICKPNFPYRIDLPDGTHVRFGDLVCAAATAADRKLPVVDEVTGNTYGVKDCIRISNGVRKL